MTRRNPPAKWVLPNVINPATSTCWRVPVPDDPFHKAAFLGALAALGAAYKWQDDTAHTAKQVADVWREIADNLERCQDNPEQLIRMYENEDTMPIRTDCDCNVFVKCCDDTEKQLVTTDMINLPNQPGAGTPQPGPGQSQCYSGHLFADKFWLIPTIVNSGDVITIDSISGSTSDDHISWYCPDGSIFFAGACGGGQATRGTDVAPSLYHMQVIAEINGVFYSAKPGDTITVPGGISNQIAVLRMNCLTDPTGNSGDLTVKVCVQNNAAATWCHEFDFALTNGGFVVSHYGVDFSLGVWTPGTGWTNTDHQDGALNNWYRGAAIVLDSIPPFTITNIEMTYDRTNGYQADDAIELDVAVYDGSFHDITLLNVSSLTSGTNLTAGGSAAYSGVTKLVLFVAASQAAPSDGGLLTGSMNIKKCTVRGTGTNPFGSSNCP